MVAASSLNLAASRSPLRASRSASRGAVDTLPSDYVDPPDVAPTSVDSITAASIVHRASSESSSTKTTTKKHSTTTTTTKPKHTTTTSPKPTSPPRNRSATPPKATSSTGQSETGQATWYDNSDPTMCAHKTLPMGTVVTVTDVDNGKSTTCKVGDRGPYVDGRIIDLSPETFQQLAPLSDGVINVKITW